MQPNSVFDGLTDRSLDDCTIGIEDGRFKIFGLFGAYVGVRVLLFGISFVA
jgi:hypothetical protein